MTDESRHALLRSLRRRIGDPRVLAAMAEVPRDRFVPERERGRAWDDEALPIGRGQTISQPLVVALMCELLDVHPGDRVLDVGTGSGYHAAVLRALGGDVWSIERDAVLAERARPLLERAGVHVIVGDGSLGWPAAAPYDVINVAAASEGDIPDALLDQLGPGGRLVLPVRKRLVLVRRREDGVFERRDEGAVAFVPLLGGVVRDGDEA